MSKIIVTGGVKLSGKVKLAGNKNSALKLLAASLLANSKVNFENMPKIRDVDVMLELLEELGVKVRGKGKNEVVIDPTHLKYHTLNEDLTGKIRASVVLAAPLLARFGKSIITPPGGDQIGERLLTTHFSMMEKFGVTISKKGKKYELKWSKKNEDRLIFLEEASVTATEMALILASSIESKTIIEGAAMEPHVVDLADFLVQMGAKISGASTGTIEVVGNSKLTGVTHSVVPDHIEGGTFAIAAAITGGKVDIYPFIESHYRMILKYLKQMGVKYEIKEDVLKILPSTLKAEQKKFHTRPWPGFPTDLMSPFIVLATQTKGTVLCHDWMYEWRMFFVDDLISMGANIFIADPHRVIISGKTPLTGEKLYSKDIRAGMSLILAALVAEGKSEIDNIEMVERGYEDIEERFKKLGAKLKRVNGKNKLK